MVFILNPLKNTKKMMPFAVKSITLHNSAYKHCHQDKLCALRDMLTITRTTLHDGATFT